jgi:hypothetical protein
MTSDAGGISFESGHRSYTPLSPDRKPFESGRPGTLSGYKRSRIYGRLDCPVALRAIERGGYVASRVFFADEKTATAAGYRPCGACLPEEYRAWKERGQSAIRTHS